MVIQKETKLQIQLRDAHHTYEKSLNAHAFFKTHDHAVGEDLVQDTFLKVWKYLVKGGKVQTMKAFLYHVLGDLIIDKYRKGKTLSLDVLIDNGYEPAAQALDLTRVFDGQTAIHLIPRLSGKYKEVMNLRYVDDMTLNEISRVTKRSKNTVAVQIHRGIEKLKELESPTLVRHKK